jgi:hypothetical protein
MPRELFCLSVQSYFFAVLAKFIKLQTLAVVGGFAFLVALRLVV